MSLRAIRHKRRRSNPYFRGGQRIASSLTLLAMTDNFNQNVRYQNRAIPKIFWRQYVLTKVNVWVNIDIKEIGMSRIKSIGMAEARPKLTQLVDEVSGGGEPYLIVSGSQVKAVLIGLNQYNDMVERLEDVSDAAELLQAELDEEPTMPFEEHLTKSKELKSGVSTGS